jgi:serine protease inhibitor
VDLAMPRWDFAADVALKDELIRLGVVDAFDPDAADFSA